MVAVVAAPFFVGGLASSASARRAPATRQCFCFAWIHGDDFGTSCEPTLAACEQEARDLGREHTDCRGTRRPACDDEATIGGQRMRRD